MNYLNSYIKKFYIDKLNNYLNIALEGTINDWPMPELK